MLFPKLITKSLYSSIREHYPAARTDKKLLRFLMYISFGCFRSKFTKHRQLILSQDICAILEEVSTDLNNYCASDYLEQMKEHLPEMTYSTWKYDTIDNHPRLLINSGLSDKFKEILEFEKHNIINTPKEQLVNYFTGSIFNRIRHKEQLEKQDEEEAILYGTKNVVELQKDMLDYFNGLPTHSFNLALKNNLQSAYQLCLSFNFKDEETRSNNIKMLDMIKLQPKPNYYATDGGRRLTALAGTIPYLKREIRKELTRGWIEFDIVNCHLAIIAKDWDIPELFELLSKGKSIWKYLDDHIPNASKHKDKLKPIIYGLVYGDSKSSLRQKLEGSGHTKKQSKLFFEIPIIKLIYLARKKQLIEATILPTDCFGEKIEIPYSNPNKPYCQHPARSILSKKAQAVELKMLEPLIKFSKDNKNIMMAVLYQFDGFSVVCKQPSRIKSHCNKMKKTMDSHLIEMGYPSSVEYSINE